MTSYRFTSAALTELRQATLYYEEQENGLGAVFLDEVDSTVARIFWPTRMPGARYLRGQGDAELIDSHSVLSTRFVPMRFLLPP